MTTFKFSVAQIIASYLKTPYVPIVGDFTFMQPSPLRGHNTIRFACPLTNVVCSDLDDPYIFWRDVEYVYSRSMILTSIADRLKIPRAAVEGFIDGVDGNVYHPLPSTDPNAPTLYDGAYTVGCEVVRRLKPRRQM